MVFFIFLLPARAALKCYDEPVRAWLKKRFLTAPARPESLSALFIAGLFLAAVGVFV